MRKEPQVGVIACLHQLSWNSISLKYWRSRANRDMKRWKLMVRSAVKVVAAIAGVLFLVANPLSANWAIAFFISIPALLVCLFLWHLVDENDDGGYWPQKPPTNGG